MAWYYMSFADGTRPKGRQFLGALYVEAPTSVQAIFIAHERKINPGGEVEILEVPAGFEPLVGQQYRLLSAKEARESRCYPIPTEVTP